MREVDCFVELFDMLRRCATDMWKEGMRFGDMKYFRKSEHFTSGFVRNCKGTIMETWPSFRH